MNIDQMRQFIHGKIKTMEYTSEIYDFVQLNSIPGTTNNNGIFINLTALSEDNIKLLYEKTKYYSELKHININDIIENTYEKIDVNEIKASKPKLKNIPQGKNLKCTALETTILSFS